MSKGSFNSGKYDFVGKGRYILPIWVVVMVFGIFLLFTKGLNYGIDFAGGTEIQVRFSQEADIEKLRQTVADAGFEDSMVQSFGGVSEFLIRVETHPGKTDKETSEIQKVLAEKITTGIAANFKDNPHEIRRVDTVGPQVGDELKRNSILAAFYSLLMILVYVGMRFDYKYAPGAVFCLLHDAIILIALFSLIGREVNVQTLAAILTLMGAALNATIVLYDRIRENEAFYPDEDFSEVVNKSHNDILSRTIVTGLVMELSVAALYFLSDGVVQQIGFTLGIGILLGIFSSTYVAGSIVIEIDKFEKRKRARTQMRAAKA
jgi:preprotein translocase subunit SecF